MSRRVRTLLLASLLVLSPAAPAATPGYPIDLASRMMELMWDTMLWFFTGAERLPGSAGGGYPGAWGGNFGGWRGGFVPRHGLDGFWIGPRGERLTVQQGRFAYEAGHRRLEGWMAVEGERIVASNPAVGLNQVFAYRRQGDRLLVASPDGQLFAFVRWYPGGGVRQR